MPTSHRADGPALRPRGRRLAVPIVVVLVVLAGWWAAHHLGGGSPTPVGAGSPNGAHSGSPSPASHSPAASATPSPSPTASATVSAPRSRHLAHLPAEPPDRLVVDALVDAHFGEAVVPTGGRLIPSSPDLAQRVATRALPGSPARDSVMIVGAAISDGTGPFADLGKARPGDRIEITTSAGTLTYTIESLGSHPANDVLGLQPVENHTPGRLVLDVAHYTGGNRVGDDLLVVAQLSAVSAS